MADDADMAVDESMFRLDMNLRRTRGMLVHEAERPKLQIDTSNPSRICWQCPAQTESEHHRWCSTECREAWARENE